MINKVQINIFTTGLVWKGFIDDVKSLVHRTSWNQIATSEIRINKSSLYLEEMQTGRVLVINNQRYKALIIEEIESNLDDETIRFNCVSLKGILNYRICNPKYINKITNQRQGRVMQILVEKNVIFESQDINRKFMNDDNTKNMLFLDDNREWGDYVSFSIDWDTGLLGDALTTISNMYDTQPGQSLYPLGWNVYINPSYDGYTFDVYYGNHREASQTTSPPVVFSEAFGNIKNISFQKSIRDMKTFAYATYNNGAIDTYLQVKNPRYIDAEAETRSFQRREVVIDSSKEVNGEVVSEAIAEMNNSMSISQSFTAEIINSEETMTQLEKDWILGDIVTIESSNVIPGVNIYMDAQTREIEEIYEDGQYRLNVTFGDGYINFPKKVKNIFKSLKTIKNKDI